MPDITMCEAIRCTARKSCYRYRAIPNPCRQAYSAFDATLGIRCQHRIIITPTDRVRDTADVDALFNKSPQVA